MPELTALDLARIQFGFTIAFHIIFPAITIGLASYLAVLEACWLRTRQRVYRGLYHFWSKIFAVNFGMGVVYLLRLIRIGPVPHGGQEIPTGGPGQQRQPMRPLSAASEHE